MCRSAFSQAPCQVHCCLVLRWEGLCPSVVEPLTMACRHASHLHVLSFGHLEDQGAGCGCRRPLGTHLCQDSERGGRVWPLQVGSTLVLLVAWILSRPLLVWVGAAMPAFWRAPVP